MDFALLTFEEITLDTAYQARTGLLPAVVDEYAQAMHDGAKFPPVDAYRLPDGRIVLVDGWHRYTAAQQENFLNLPVNVYTGTEDEALRFALMANQKHGMRRTNEDKRRAVSMMLDHPEWNKMSDRVIAIELGVSNVLVSTMQKERKQAPTGNSVVNGLQVEEVSNSKIGKDGKTYTHRPSNSGNPESEAKEPHTMQDKKITKNKADKADYKKNSSVSTSAPGKDRGTFQDGSQEASEGLQRVSLTFTHRMSQNEVMRVLTGFLEDITNQTSGDIAWVASEVNRGLGYLGIDADSYD